MTHKRTRVNRTTKTGRFVTRSRATRPKLHVVRKPTGGWAIKQSGTRKATGIFRSQREAVAAARDLAHETSASVVVHRRDGTIRQEYRGRHRSGATERPATGFGCARGLITLAPDFDEPMADFADYT